VFVEAMPTTATGKIRRVELRAMAATLLLDPVAPPEDQPEDQIPVAT
jgi:acyl-coenzyme A synthetase/AMP-(fatty) acid ligase